MSKMACINCLGIVKGPGALCDKCWAIANSMLAPEWPMDEEAPFDSKPDVLWIDQLKERRMKSYARARKMARRG